MKWPSHGSNPQYLYKAMDLPYPSELIDFSANINPLGPPSTLKNKWESLFQRIMVYPDPYAANLKESISIKEKVPEDYIMIGNGGAELITLVARLLAGKKILIVQPTFSEYERVCYANHCEIFYHHLKEPNFELNLIDLFSKIQEVDAIFLCNPNNPTGIQYPISMILSLLEKCEEHDCHLILDEAFYDFLMEYDSVVPYLNTYSNLILIRSMTKMFAIPGIRLGYLIAHPTLITELGALQSHWNTNTIALVTGELCIQNEGFVDQTKTYIHEERRRLFDFFKIYNFEVTQTKVNFYLLRDPNARDQFELFQFLLKRGIVPRHTFNFPGLEGRWLRFAIKEMDANERLMEVLKEWRQNLH